MASLAASSLIRNSAMGAVAYLPSASQTQSFAGFNSFKAYPVLQSASSRAAPLILRCSRPLQVFCAASPETVSKVVEIVTSQLASKPGVVQPHSKFSELGADSLDQVEIVMALEEKFDISIDEEGAESIATVQDAADIIEKMKGLSKAVA